MDGVLFSTMSKKIAENALNTENTNGEQKAVTKRTVRGESRNGYPRKQLTGVANSTYTAANKKAPMLHACPMHNVATSGLMNCIVS